MSKFVIPKSRRLYVVRVTLILQILVGFCCTSSAWGSDAEVDAIADIEKRLSALESRVESEFSDVAAALENLEKKVEYNAEQTSLVWEELSKTESSGRRFYNRKFPRIIKNTGNKHDVVCYFNAWMSTTEGGKELQPENIDPTLCTVIVYYRAHLDPDTFLLKPAFPSLNESSDFYKRVISLKTKNPELRVLLSVGSWFDSETEIYHRVLENSSIRKAFVLDTVRFLKLHGFDGLDVFWVYPLTWLSKSKVGPQESQFNFVLLLEELREAFEEQGGRLWITLSVDAHKSKLYPAFPLRTISNLVDRVHILLMLSCPLDVTCLHSPLYSHPDLPPPKYTVNDTVHLWIGQDVPRRKIVVIILSSGMSYHLVEPSNHSVGVPAKMNIRFTNFGKMCSYMKQQNWVFVHHAATETYYAYDSTNSWESYEIPMTVARKAAFVKEEKLGGAGIWLLSRDDHSGLCCGIKYPLLTTINSVLESKDEIDDVPCQEVFNVTST